MIFINYRRDDSMGVAGRLYDRLAHAFGRKTLFMDVDHIPPGVDFANHLNQQVAACEVFIAVIGPHWLDARNEQGDRRLDAPDDFVAIEIAAALARDIRVIPVLIDGARMPKAGDLPETLKPLVRRHAINLRHDHFGRDAEALIERIREALPAKPARSPWRAVAATISVLLLLVSIGVFVTGIPLSLPWTVEPQEQAERLAAVEVEDKQAKAAADAEAKARAEQAETERQAAAQAEEERRKAAAEADARTAAEQAEKERLAALKAQEARKKLADEARHGWLGVRIQQVTDEIAEALNIKPPRGALVAAIDDKGPLKPAGIESGDVIVKYDGTEIKEVRDLPRAVLQTLPGTVVSVVIIRRGKEETRKVTVGLLANPGTTPAKQP